MQSVTALSTEDDDEEEDGEEDEVYEARLLTSYSSLSLFHKIYMFESTKHNRPIRKVSCFHETLASSFRDLVSPSTGVQKTDKDYLEYRLRELLLRFVPDDHVYVHIVNIKRSKHSQC